MVNATEKNAIDRPIHLPDGMELPGRAPVVVIGPNGSGKTRLVRELKTGGSVDFINALRNTRIQLSLPAMSYVDAENNFVGQRNQSRQNHWDWTNEFDFLLASLLAGHASTAINFMDAIKAGNEPPITADTLQKIRDLWTEFFPGRQLVIRDYRLMIVSTTAGQTLEYAAQTMSDGERTAIYLAGRVLRSEPGVLVVDEPEIHLHPLLAGRLWSTLEQARPDIRFVYITHDLTFARSRKNAQYVVASPVEGLMVSNVAGELDDEVAEVLLGAASLSFYARRIVLCEGEADDRDALLYGAWFGDGDTVVRAVGSSTMVQKCIAGLEGRWLVGNIRAIGIIDRDFHPDEYIASLPPALYVLRVHEIESLYCLPGIAEGVALHLQRPFSPQAYSACLRNCATDMEIRKVVLERWKRRVEPLLVGVAAGVHSRVDSLDAVVASLPQTFDATSWGFSPEQLLKAEKQRIEDAVARGSVDDLLRLMPGKAMLAAAAQYVGQQPNDYVHLVNQSLRGASGLEMLTAAVEAAWSPVLPPRVAPLS